MTEHSLVPISELDDTEEITIPSPGEIWKKIAPFLLSALLGVLATIVCFRAALPATGGSVPVVTVEYVSVSEP